VPLAINADDAISVLQLSPKADFFGTVNGPEIKSERSAPVFINQAVAQL
jgi:hypothetical protein